MKPISEMIDDLESGGTLEDIPAVIETRGRVKGFEAIRDKLLIDWENFIGRGMSPYAVLKLVIEMDRHAMFAENQKSKKDELDQKAYAEFQDYLHGKTELPAANAEAYIAEQVGDAAEEEDENA